MILQTRDDEITIKRYDEFWFGEWKVYTYKNRIHNLWLGWKLSIEDIIIGKIELTKIIIMLIAKN